LMTARIDWNDSVIRQVTGKAAEDAEDGSGKKKGANFCRLVWTGVASTRHFSGFRFEECMSGLAARRFMHTKGLAHYWDMVAGSDNLEAVTNAAPLPGFAAGGDEEVDVEKLFAAPTSADADM
jgi:hypothetical protein